MESTFTESRSYRPYDGSEADPFAVIDTDIDRLERILGEFPETEIWTRPADGVSSLGNLIAHLAGSLEDWLRGGVLGRPVDRNRTDEFDRGEGSPEELMALLQEMRSVLRDCRERAPDFAATVSFRGKERQVGYLVYQQIEHVGYHLGQAALLRRLVAGLDRNYP